MLNLYVDAARKAETGQSTAGCVVIEAHQQRQLKAALPKTQDNHEAEFRAAYWALDQLGGADPLHLYFDSQIVVDALNKHYAKHYQDQVDAIDRLLADRPLVLVSWVPEKNNQGAHHLAQQALKKTDR
ncbi:ribonuclease HI family protein [Lactobacillaceae bacterium L1_55_11]|nr:ribonuclease HI family protein [Lactobacillaceae bacterium L1_55_11]